MAIKRPDIYEHNNPDLAIVDSDFERGGGRVVANITALYALSSKIDQLKEKITRVYVTSVSSYYILIDITNVGNSAGWQLDSTIVGNHYLHNQSTTASTWNIAHNLGFYPNIMVQTSAGVTVHGDITYVDANNVTIVFSGGGFQGKAYLS